MEAKKANYLYVQCLRMGELCLTKRNPVAIEFPSQLSEDHVTLADFPQAQALLALEGVRLIKLHQCRFGCSSMKPTTLLCFGDAWAALALECDHPWVSSSNKNWDGTFIMRPPHESALTLSYKNKKGGKWKTAGLAAYPSRLNAAIADAITASVAAEPPANQKQGLENGP